MGAAQPGHVTVTLAGCWAPDGPVIKRVTRALCGPAEVTPERHHGVYGASWHTWRLAPSAQQNQLSRRAALRCDAPLRPANSQPPLPSTAASNTLIKNLFTSPRNMRSNDDPGSSHTKFLNACISELFS